MSHLSFLLFLGPKFLCVLGFRTGNPSVPRRPLSVVFSCEHSCVLCLCRTRLVFTTAAEKNADRGCSGGFLASPHGLDKSRLPLLFPVWGSGVEIHSAAHTRNLGGHLFPHSLHLVRPQPLISTFFDHDP